MIIWMLLITIYTDTTEYYYSAGFSSQEACYNARISLLQDQHPEEFRDITARCEPIKKGP